MRQQLDAPCRYKTRQMVDEGPSSWARGFVSVGSRRYQEWQNLAYETTIDESCRIPPPVEEDARPLVERSLHRIPNKILKREGRSTLDIQIANVAVPRSS